MNNSIIPASWLTPCTIDQLLQNDRFVYCYADVMLPQYVTVLSISDGFVHLCNSLGRHFSLSVSGWGQVPVWTLPSRLFVELVVPSVCFCSNCKIAEAERLHTCPFREEINNDFETTCDCCSDCEGECHADI